MVTAMAKVLAIIIAVLIDRYADQLPGGNLLPRFRSSAWTSSYTNKMLQAAQKFNIKQNYFVALFLFIPLCVALLLFKLVLVGILGTAGWVLFSAAALLYFMGNIDAQEHGSGFILAHERHFAVLFWFAILGPWGALLYWFLVVTRQTTTLTEPGNADLLSLIGWLHAVFAWIPARITGFIYALVGNFTSGFNVWLNCMRRTNMQSSQLLEECGGASVDANIIADDENLVTRAFFAWVILSILIVVVLK